MNSEHNNNKNGTYRATITQQKEKKRGNEKKCMPMQNRQVNRKIIIEGNNREENGNTPHKRMHKEYKRTTFTIETGLTI